MVVSKANDGDEDAAMEGARVTNCISAGAELL